MTLSEQEKRVADWRRERAWEVVEGSSAVGDGGRAAVALTSDVRVPVYVQVLYLRNITALPQIEITYMTGHANACLQL